MEIFHLLQPATEPGDGVDEAADAYAERLAQALEASAPAGAPGVGRPDTPRLHRLAVGDADSLRRAVLAVAGSGRGVALVPDRLAGRLAAAARNDAQAAAVLADAVILLTRAPPRDEPASPLVEGLHAARLVAAASPTLHDQMAGLAGDPVRALLLLPGSTAATQRPPTTDAATCRLLCAGPLAAEAVGILVDALARLPDLEWQLTLVGGPADAQAAFAAAGLERRVDFAPSLDETAGKAAGMAALWAAADIFVLPSRAEFLAGPALAALRRGLPVALTAPSQIVPATLGVVALPADAAGLSRSLRRLICDTRLRGLVAEACRDYAVGLPTWPEQARRLVDALRAT